MVGELSDIYDGIDPSMARILIIIWQQNYFSEWRASKIKVALANA